MTLILGALAEELEEYRNHLSSRRDEPWQHLVFMRGVLGRHEVVIGSTGVGKTMSALAAQHAVERFAPERILFTGIAGALNPRLAVGDIVVARESLQYDLDARAAGFELGRVPFTQYRWIPSDPTLVSAAMSFHPEGYGLLAGRVLTGDRVVARMSEEDTDLLVRRLGGDAVEMEGASAGLVAAVNGLPFLNVRAISDRVGGSTKVNLRSFLPVASSRCYEIVAHLLDTVLDGRLDTDRGGR